VNSEKIDSKPLILIIDDDEIIRQTIGFFLEEEEYTYTEAKNGRDGIKKIDALQPDIVLCDLNMPDISGLDVLQFTKEKYPLLPIIIISGQGDVSDAISTIKLGAWDYVLKPFLNNFANLTNAIKRSIERAELIRKNKMYKEHLETLVQERTKKLEDEIKIRTKAQKENEKMLNQIQQTLNAIIETIAAAIALKDPYTADHQKRVAKLAKLIAEELNLDQNTINGIYLAGTIHDVGKIAIPSEILIKPTKLSSSEFMLIKNHSFSGYQILKNIEFPWPIADIVFQHHEKLDGSGYPNGLSNGDILIQAKIITVADVVEAMAANRPYRPSLGFEKAINEIKDNRGITYEKDIVDACLKVIQSNKFQLI